MRWSLPLWPTCKVRGQSLEIFNNFIKMCTATYDAFQYTLNDHIDHIREYTIMYSKKLQKSSQSCHSVGCNYFSDPHTYSCVCVIHPPHTIFLAYTCQCSQVQQTPSHKEQSCSAGTKKCMCEPTLTLGMCSRYSFPCAHTSTGRSQQHSP